MAACPRMVVSGVRSSWLASATKRRSRASESARAANACSIWASMLLSAAESRPTSVPASAGRHAAGQVSCRDVLGGVLDLAQGPQSDRHDEPRADGDQDEGRDAGDGSDVSHPDQGGLCVGERHRHHDVSVTTVQRCDMNPPFGAEAVGRSNRHASPGVRRDGRAGDSGQVGARDVRLGCGADAREGAVSSHEGEHEVGGKRRARCRLIGAQQRSVDAAERPTRRDPTRLLPGPVVEIDAKQDHTGHAGDDETERSQQQQTGDEAQAQGHRYGFVLGTRRV